eukprot:6493091-Karenia_brevis.AAC.1
MFGGRGLEGGVEYSPPGQPYFFLRGTSSEEQRRAADSKPRGGGRMPRGPLGGASVTRLPLPHGCISART